MESVVEEETKLAACLYKLCYPQFHSILLQENELLFYSIELSLIELIQIDTFISR
jgi:hypothetical protein